jgi:hypothetical protein
MIISDNSQLRRLPAELNHKQTLYLDGIRYSIEMADLAHTRLRNTLEILTNNALTDGQSSTVSNNHSDVTSAVLDAWSIVDSLYRLRGLLDQAPGFKKKSPALRVVKQNTEATEQLRHAVQHLNQHINRLVSLDLPVWGELSWFVISPDCRSGFSCWLRTGTIFKSMGQPIVNPVGKTIDPPVDLVTLAAHEHSICLSNAMRVVERLTKSIEDQLKEQFSDRPQAGADLLLCAELQIHDSDPSEPAQTS